MSKPRKNNEESALEQGPISLDPLGVTGQQNSLWELLPVSLVVTDKDGRILFTNKYLEDQIGVIVGRNIREFYEDPEEHQRITGSIVQKGSLENYELLLRKPDGELAWVLVSARPIEFDGEVAFLASLINITERKRTENILQTRLRLMQFAESHSLEELLQATLNEVETLTNSSIGFYHFLEPDQKTLTLQAWSTNTLEKKCTAEGQGRHYDVQEAGVWVDCIYERRPIIHNDYEALPHRKGMPPGHASVSRELVIPVLRENKIVAILGVGNKPHNYDENDVELVSLLADLAWDIAERKQTEEQLRKLSRAVEHSPASIVVTDPDGTIEFVNPYFTEITGYEREEAIGKNPRILKSGQTPREEYQRLWQTIKSGNEWRGEFCNIKKNGNLYWESASIAPVIDGFGKITHFVAIKTDITEQKQAEKALQESEEKYRALFNQNHDAIFVLDFDGRNKDVNQRAADMLGYAREELRSLSNKDISAEPEQSKQVIERLTDGEQVPLYERIFKKKNGDLIFVEINAELVHDMDGQPLHIQSVVRDITERKRVEKALLDSEEHYRALFEHLPIPVFTKDRDGRYMSCNAENLRYWHENPVGKTDAELLQPEVARALREADLHVMETESVFTLEEHLANTPLGERQVFSRKVPLRDLNGNVAGILGASIDITERRQAEERLARHTERLGILHTMEQAITSSLELNKLLQLLVQKVVEQLKIDACTVLLFNPQSNRLEFAAKQGFYTKALDFTKLTIGAGLAGQAARDRRIIYIANVAEISDNPVLMQAISDEKMVSYFGVPLLAKGQLLGVMEIFNRSMLTPDPDWLEFLETLANQVAISIDNARLLEMTQQSLKETNALYQINQYLIATIDPELLMTNVVDLLQESFGYYYVQIFVADPKTGDFIMRAGSGEIGERIKAQDYRLAAGEGIVGFTAETGKPFFTNDVDQVISFVRMPYLQNTKSELAVPIMVGGQFLGLLDIHQLPPAVLTDRDMQLVSAVADQLAEALHKAELYFDLQDALRQEQATRAQLIHTEKLTLTGRLLASVSHELNNPIQAIQNALFLLKEDQGLSPQGKQDLKIILSETDRMVTLLERLRSNYQPVSREEFQPVQVNKLIEDTSALVGTHLRHGLISFEFLPDPNLPMISGLSSQLRQVFLNLVMNAAEAMESGGRLTITTEFLQENQEILVTVTDTGTGISPAILPNIFDAFITSKEQGTGLGLAISYEIILKHHGRIKAENNPDRGAKFSVWLPVENKGN